MKQFQKLIFQPGINREGTNYSAEGFWWDCNRVRFRRGLPETIGGWVKYIETAFAGVCRKMKSWTTLDTAQMLALGTSERLYIENSGALFDITPIVVTFTEINPIKTGVAGTSIVTITVASPHKSNAGDYMIVSGADAVDGISTGALNVEFIILSTPTTSSVTVDTGAVCTTGGITGGGAAVKIDFLLPVGAEAASKGSGWGTSWWSRGPWGSSAASPPTAHATLRIWSLANYGEDLVAAAFGQGIYYWDATNGLSKHAILFSELPDAVSVPEQVGYGMVTPERHVVVFGASDITTGIYDPMLIRWSSQEAPEDWLPSVTNTAGDYRLSTGANITAFAATRDETLVLTDSAMYSMVYSGPPFVFNFRLVADNISISGPNAIQTLNNVTYWMGHHRFYLYNGTSQPIPCTVQRHVFNDFNHAQSREVCAGHVEHFSEIWWFYPSANSDVIDRYVVYNYTDQIWYIGDLGRTAWEQLADTHTLVAASSDGHLYEQESGTKDASTDPPSPLISFIESSDFDIADGTQHYFVERIIPDMRFDRSESAIPEVHITLKARDFPGQDYQTPEQETVYRTATVPVDQYTREMWVRVRGRHVAIRVECDADDTGTAWQCGHTRLSIRTDGRR